MNLGMEIFNARHLINKHHVAKQRTSESQTRELYLASITAHKLHMPATQRCHLRAALYSSKAKHIWKPCSSPSSWSHQKESPTWITWAVLPTVLKLVEFNITVRCLPPHAAANHIMERQTILLEQEFEDQITEGTKESVARRRPLAIAAAPQPTPFTFLFSLIDVLLFPAHCAVSASILKKKQSFYSHTLLQ